MYAYMRTDMKICEHICIYARIYACEHVCTYARRSACMRDYKHICEYILKKFSDEMMDIHATILAQENNSNCIKVFYVSGAGSDSGSA